MLLYKTTARNLELGQHFYLRGYKTPFKVLEVAEQVKIIHLRSRQINRLSLDYPVLSPSFPLKPYHKQTIIVSPN